MKFHLIKDDSGRAVCSPHIAKRCIINLEKFATIPLEYRCGNCRDFTIIAIRKAAKEGGLTLDAATLVATEMGAK